MLEVFLLIDEMYKWLFSKESKDTCTHLLFLTSASPQSLQSRMHTDVLESVSGDHPEGMSLIMR